MAGLGADRETAWLGAMTIAQHFNGADRPALPGDAPQEVFAALTSNLPPLSLALSP